MKGDGAFSIDTIEDVGAEIILKKEGVVACTTDLTGGGATVQKNEEVASVVSTADTTEDGMTIPGNDEGD